MNKNDIMVGDQISFIYNGGSRPGATRIVDVKEIYEKVFKGFDHYNTDDRTFAYDKVGNFTYKYKKPRGINVEVSHSQSMNWSLYNVTFTDNTKLKIGIHDNSIAMNGVLIKSLKDLQMVSDLYNKNPGLYIVN
jgi:ribosomal protein L32E